MGSLHCAVRADRVALRPIARFSQVVGDLVELCRALKPHVLDIIENVTDEGCLNLALTVHDELTRVLQSYDKIMADQGSRPPPPAPGACPAELLASCVGVVPARATCAARRV